MAVRAWCCYPSVCAVQVELSCQDFNFGRVEYDVPVTRQLQIDNTGQVIVEFHFTAKVRHLSC